MISLHRCVIINLFYVKLLFMTPQIPIFNHKAFVNSVLKNLTFLFSEYQLTIIHSFNYSEKFCKIKMIINDRRSLKVKLK